MAGSAELAAQLEAFRGEQGNLLVHIGAASAHAVRILLWSVVQCTEALLLLFCSVCLATKKTANHHLFPNRFIPSARLIAGRRCVWSL
jgi:hypothetical protein